MAVREPEALAMIHRIRERQYQETHHLSGQQQIHYVQAKARPLIRKLGLRLVRAKLILPVDDVRRRVAS